MRSLFLLIISTLFVLGLVMIFSATSADVLDHDLEQSTHQALLKQLVYAAMGVIAGWGCYRLGYDRWISLSPLLLTLVTFMLILVLIPGLGRSVNGSRRWLSFAGFSLQPSELSKYIIPAYFIYMCQKEGSSITLKYFLRVVAIVCTPLLLILVEPNNGTTAVIGLSLSLLCFLSRIPFKFWAWPLATLIVVGAVFAYQLPYFTGRINVYLHPELDLKGKGHQPYQAKIAAGSGGWFGRGPGNGLQKLSYLPEAQNDYIAAIYAEEFGFFGIFGLILCYTLLGFIGFYISFHSEDPRALLLGGAITFLICFQAFMNLGVVSGLLPSTGLNLPFFSQGGTSLIACFCGIGLLLSISKTGTSLGKSIV